MGQSYNGIERRASAFGVASPSEIGKREIPALGTGLPSEKPGKEPWGWATDFEKNQKPAKKDPRGEKKREVAATHL